MQKKKEKSRKRLPKTNQETSQGEGLSLRSSALRRKQSVTCGLWRKKGGEKSGQKEEKKESEERSNSWLRALVVY